MREVSHFLSELTELKNGSESRDVSGNGSGSGSGNEVPPYVAAAITNGNEPLSGAGTNNTASPGPISFDPLQSASPEARVSE